MHQPQTMQGAPGFYRDCFCLQHPCMYASMYKYVCIDVCASMCYVTYTKLSADNHMHACT